MGLSPGRVLYINLERGSVACSYGIILRDWVEVACDSRNMGALPFERTFQMQRLMPMLPCLVPEVTVLEPLKDVQLSEGQDAHFQCRLSRASGQEARWALGGVPLQCNEMNDITVEQGTLYLLTLHKVGLCFSLDIEGSEMVREDLPPWRWVGEVTRPLSLGPGKIDPFRSGWGASQASSSCLFR